MHLMANFGDTPIDHMEPQFTLGEACGVSGVAEADLRNWLKRGVVDVGMKHRMGRWQFNFPDVAFLRAMNELMVIAKMEPARAAAVAEFVRKRWYEMLTRNPDGSIGNRNIDGSRDDTRILIHFAPADSEDKGPVVQLVSWDGEAYSLKASRRGAPDDWRRRTMIVIPADQIIFDSHKALSAILEKEHEED